MKILLVNTFDKGGAANACLRLHEGLLSDGVDSNVLLRSKTKNSPFTFTTKPKKIKYTTYQKLKLKIKRILKELKLLKIKPQKKNSFLGDRDTNLELFSYPNSNFDITESPLYKDADIINLHWVAGFLDYESFFKKNKKPVVWTLHDMNPFTGGEHYEETIVGIDNSGNPTQRILRDFEIKEFNKILNVKESIFKNAKNLHIVTLCNWMSNEVKKSTILNKYPIYLIPNSADTSIFKPRDKKYSREILNLPTNKKIILFVADSISNNRKGFIFLKMALEKINQKDVVLCAIGSKKTSFDNQNNIVELGPIYDERLMSIAYSAADVYIIPSLMDNLPNTVIESILCGTPVIGFPVGGIMDIIQHRENGLLTNEISASSLLETIILFFKDIEQFDREQIRENAVKKYNQVLQVSRYKEIFDNLIN